MERNIGTFGALGGGVSGAFKAELEKRKAKPGILLMDILTFVLCFVYARWHLLFGSYPMAVAFVAAASSEVWVSLIGTVVGSLSIGGAGVIRALAALIVVFLRVLISGGNKKDGEPRTMFAERMILRAAAAFVGAFIAAVYGLLLVEINTVNVLYAVFSCVVTVAFSLIFCGLFSADVGFFDIVFGRSAVFERKRNGKDKYSLIIFQISASVLLFTFSLSLSEYGLFGVDFDFVFAAFVTLFTAKRFGAVRGMAVGFLSSLGVSSMYSVSFALLGLGAGLLFPIAPAYAFVGGGVMLSAWSAYSGGLVGFLSTFPEYATAIALFFPFLKSLNTEKREEIREDTRRIASDMVASMALSHRNERGGCIDRLSASVSELSAAIRRFGKSEACITYDDVRSFLLEELREGCTACPHYDDCLAVNPAPCIEILDEMSIKVYKNMRISRFDATAFPDYCNNGEYLIDHLVRAFGIFSMDKYKDRRLSELGEEYELMAKLINEARLAEEREWVQDKPLSEELETALLDAGLDSGVVRAYGERTPRLIIAGEDPIGDIISSKSLLDGLSRISACRLGTPEYYRKGAVALSDIPVSTSYALDFASASRTADGAEVSGDTAASFISEDNYFYLLLSDGMGSGALASESSHFTLEFMRAILSASVTYASAVSALNSIIRRRGEECSVTLDLFTFDLLHGEAGFLKSGAAASYVKRENSLFRIRSETLPLGISKSIDTERIRVECREGDMIIMLSDGVGGGNEPAPWLAEFLAKPCRTDLKEYAEQIIELAAKNSRSRDDMTVAVALIKRESK